MNNQTVCQLVKLRQNHANATVDLRAGNCMLRLNAKYAIRSGNCLPLKVSAIEGTNATSFATLDFSTARSPRDNNGSSPLRAIIICHSTCQLAGSNETPTSGTVSLVGGLLEFPSFCRSNRKRQRHRASKIGETAAAVRQRYFEPIVR